MSHPGESASPSQKVESAPEKEILKSLLGEKINQQAPAYQVKPSPKPLTDGDVPSYLDPAIKSKVDELIKIVFDISLEEGIQRAVKGNNPALIDAFHDILADELYAKLLESRKLEKMQ